MRRAVERALVDSARLAGSAFEAEAALRIEIRQGDRNVTVDERLSLRKQKGGAFVTQSAGRTISGDTTILKDMYSFEDSKGDLRGDRKLELAGLDFGSDVLNLIRSFDAPESEVGYTIQSRDAAGGKALVRFAGDARRGSISIGSDSADVRSVVIRQGSDYLVGAYSSRMSTQYARPLGDILLPVRMQASFEFRRLFSRGTGSVRVAIFNVRSTPR